MSLAVEDRLDRVERLIERLSEAQYELDLSLARLSRDVRQLTLDLQTFKDELHADTEAFKRETKRMLREMNRRWGEMANRLGTIAEDVVYPNVPRLAAEHFAAPEEAHEWEFLALRLNKQHPHHRGTQREFDIVAAWPGAALIVEVKATVRPEMLKAFAEWLESGAFWDYFPEWRGRRLIPIFASFRLAKNEVAFLTRAGIYAMAMGDETMAILNAQALPVAPEPKTAAR